MLLTGAGNLLLNTNWDFDDPKALVGKKVSGILIDELISATNFSWVYKGIRLIGQVEQQVVVKLLLHEQSLKERHNIDREWEILASLSHPNISALLDVGADDDGRICIILEYIDGEPIDVYCERHHLTSAKRIKLVQKILTILRYTHSRLIIHGDIKPANILITEDGLIKLVDFGISKLVSDSGNNTNKKLFTPYFGAPEQKRGEPVSVETDVYQCGVLLDYLVGNGRLTFNDKNLVSKAAIGNDDLKHQEKSQKKITRLYRSDLALIIKKATSLEKLERYNSASEFESDLEKFVTLRPTSVNNTKMNVVGKFFRRNILACFLTTFFALIIVAVAASYQTKIIESNRALVIKNQQANSIAGFLSEVIGLAGQKLNTSNELTISDVIDNASEQLSTRENLSPSVRKRLALLLSSSYTKLQEYEKSLNTALLVNFERTNVDEMDIIDFNLLIRVAEAHYDLGNFEESIKLLEPFNNELLMQSVYNEQFKLNYHKLMAELFRKSGDYDRALDSISKAESISISNPDATYLKMLFNLKAGVHLNLGNYESAIIAFERALSYSQKLPDSSRSFSDIVVSGNLAILYNITDKPEKALEILDKNLQEIREHFPSRHSQLASLLNTRGMVLVSLHRLDEAERTMRNSIEIYETNYGTSFEKLVSPLQNMSLILTKLNRCSDAEFYFQRAQQIIASDKERTRFECTLAESNSTKVF